VTRHFFTTDELQAMARRYRLLKRSTAILARKLDSAERLLNIALHELALARNEKNPVDFIRRWEHDHRREEREALNKAR
jgi:hypothetical protein